MVAWVVRNSFIFFTSCVIFQFSSFSVKNGRNLVLCLIANVVMSNEKIVSSKSDIHFFITHLKLRAEHCFIYYSFKNLPPKTYCFWGIGIFESGWKKRVMTSTVQNGWVRFAIKMRLNFQIRKRPNIQIGSRDHEYIIKEKCIGKFLPPAAALNAVLNFSKLPKASLIMPATLPFGSPPHPGHIEFQ